MLAHSYKLLLFTLILNAYAGWCTAQTPTLEIWQIQGTTTSSPYRNQIVRTTDNVVTVVGPGFFFLQSPAQRADQDPETSNGIYVAYEQSSVLEAGDIVAVQGTVVESDGMTSFRSAGLQVFRSNDTDTLPTAVTLDVRFPDGNYQPVPDLEAVEGMRVQFSGIVTGPSNFNGLIYVTARMQRPFREPGIEAPGLPDLPVWDGNPEVFGLLPPALGTNNDRLINAGADIQAQGIMVESRELYILYPTVYDVTLGIEAQPVRPQQPGEITVGTYNVERLLLNNEDIAVQIRKTARYIVELLRGPHVLALQEVGSFSVLNNLADQIRRLDPSLDYTPYFLQSNGDIHLAYLVQENVLQDVSVSQLGKADMISGGGRLFDRPPLLLTASLATDPAMPIQLLNVHLRSLNGIEGNSADFVRRKRYEQSLSLARMIQQRQMENLIILGDFNAYPFSDGYVDVLHQVNGQQSEGALFPTQAIIDPVLIEPADMLPAEERYSFVFRGQAQQLDHILLTRAAAFTVVDLEIARGNADFASAYSDDVSLPLRASDHDGLVLYLKPASPLAVHSDERSRAQLVYPNPARSGSTIFLDTPGGNNGWIRLIDSRGRLILQQSAATARTEVFLPVLPSGVYYLLQWPCRFHCRTPIMIR